MSRPSLLAAVVGFAASLLVVPGAAAATIHVATADELQSALLNARPGDVIELAGGATFTGNFTLPKKDGSTASIVIRSGGAGNAAAGRVSPNGAAAFAKVRSPNGSPALQTAPGAHHWRVELLEIFGAGSGNLIALGDGGVAQNSAASVPHDIVVDRCYIHGDATQGIKRCIALNSAATTISNSYISDCKAVGEDAQAIAGWNGPGPFTIVNNYLEGSGENVLFGGADPAIPDLVPSDIEFRDNSVAKRIEWRDQKWQVKNLFELKNARRVTISGNVFEYNWEAAQSGFSILFTVRNQDGRCRWCQVEQVVFSRNLLRHVAAGFQILGFDDANPSLQTRAIEIRDNVITDMNPKQWRGNGYAFLLLGGPRDVVIDHNTLIQENSSGIIQVEGPPILGFVFTNNVARQGAYGMIGADHAPGNDTLRTFFPAALITRNVIAEADPRQYPAGNLFPTAAEFRAQFVSFDSGDYTLVPGSPWLTAGVDGRELGATAPRNRERDPRRTRDPGTK